MWHDAPLLSLTTPNSRSYLNHFTQPDSIVPDQHNSQDWNRYSYARYNPVRYTDPSGHRPCGDGEVIDCSGKLNNPKIVQHGGCGNIGQKRCGGSPATYGDGLIGPPKLPALEVEIPLLPLTTLLVAPNAECTSTAPCLGPLQNGQLNPLFDPLDPDYQSITISAGEGVGGTGAVSWDRYGNIYLGLGVNAGKSLTPVSASYARGWIGDPFDYHYPSAGDSENFLTGLAVNVSVGVLGGGGVTFSPGSNTSVIGVETGVYVPQAGVSIIYSGFLHNAK